MDISSHGDAEETKEAKRIIELEEAREGVISSALWSWHRRQSGANDRMPQFGS